MNDPSILVISILTKAQSNLCCKKVQMRLSNVKRILVANNGLASLKFIRSIRQECYKLYDDDHYIKFVVMATPEDIECHAEYVSLSDEVVTVPSGPSHLNYGNVELIVEIAQGSLVHAVWPGWGHASENPKLPDLLAQINILFLGPSSESMWLLGDKIASTIIAQSLNIPTLPWSGSEVMIEAQPDGKFKEIPAELYRKCTLSYPEDIKKCFSSIGFPMLLKASSGGGGKGIRKLWSENDYERIFKQIITEVENSPVLIVKMSSKVKHIEIQIVGDTYGNVAALSSRDCSVQRRYQKVIEEAPAIACPENILRLMEEDAVKLASSVNYSGVGTVEYLYDMRIKKYYFLEFNPRLQVEHTCTELITNTNLPWCQLLVAVGTPLTEIDVLNAYQSQYLKSGHTKPNHGHVIAARIMAENVEDCFCPCQGVCHHIKFNGTKNVFGYFSLHSNGIIHQYTDSQFGHIFSWGNTRDEARKNLIIALKQLSINGSIRTTINLLICTLEHSLFVENAIETEWLDAVYSDSKFLKKPDLSVIIACSTCCIAHKKFSSIDEEYIQSLDRGHVPDFTCFSNDIKVEFIYLSDKYSLSVSRASPSCYFLSINNSTFFVKFFPMANHGLLVSVLDRLYPCFLLEESNRYVVDIESKVCVLYKNINPSLLRSPSSGKILSTLVPDGSYILRGTEYAEIEVMKMIMPLTSSHDGTITFLKYSGSHVETDDVIATLKFSDFEKQVSIKDFDGDLNFGSDLYSEVFDMQAVSCLPRISSYTYENTAGFCMKSRNIYIKSYEALINVMEGYCISNPHFMNRVKKDLDNVVHFLSQPHFTLFLLRSALDRSKMYFPDHIFKSISRSIYNYSVNLSSILYELPVNEIISIIHTHAEVIEDFAQRELFFSNISDFLETIEQLKNGPKSYKLTKMLGILQKYVDVEKHFAESDFDSSVRHLIKNCMSQPNGNSQHSITNILRLIISHSHLAFKNTLSLMVIDIIYGITKHFVGSIENVKDIMTKISNFPSNNHLKVALRAKQFLVSSTRPSFELRYNQLESIFLSIIGGSYEMSQKVFKDVINSDGVIYDLLPSFFFSTNFQIHAIAIEVYIRRAYISYEIISIQHDRFNGIPFVIFHISKKSPQTKVAVCDKNLPSHPSFDMFSINGDVMYSFRPKCGLFVCFPSIENMMSDFLAFLSNVKSQPSMPLDTSDSFSDINESNDRGLKVVTVCVKIGGSYTEKQEVCANAFQKFMNEKHEELEKFAIRQITFLVTNLSGEFPLYFTYLVKEEYLENKLFRNIEPAEGHMLEIKKLCNYQLECIPCENPSIHIYFATLPSDTKYIEERFFIRTIVRNIGLISVEPSFDYLVKASEIRLLEALDQLAIITSKMSRSGTSNHIFFNFIPCVVIDPFLTIEFVKLIVVRHRQRLKKQKIVLAELKMIVLLEEGGEPIPLRLVARTEYGIDLQIDLYKEIKDPNTGKVTFSSFEKDEVKHLSNQLVDTPYPILTHKERKRLNANALGTTYVYDIPQLFLYSMNKNFMSLFNTSQPISLDCHYKEMILQNYDSFNLISSDREPALNTIGFVCWKFKVRGLPFDQTLKFLVVASDITFMHGSFSSNEARLFAAANRLARSKHIPFVFICCCNGARIGMAEEIKNIYKVKWKDDADYNKGFHFLYLDENDFENLENKDSVVVNKVMLDGKYYYKISDIIGTTNGIGVENLQGSGLAACEMSKSYDEIFTISLVTSRAVGIGAYLVRLGRRVVQVKNSTIILTGADTLNRVLSKNVYKSHEQLGGTNVMFSNGVSQVVVNDDLEGIKSILKWLTYHFQHQNYLNFILPTFVQRIDTNEYLNPRKLVYGYTENGKTFQGFFDKNSVYETNKGWAPTLITGRAKLYGLPVSFVLNDINTVKQIIPADPADPNDIPREYISIGQVLSPDSSFKFSQHIDDSDREKLPLFIFANFRGFSAGMKDMYLQVLKFGAMIVESLRHYKNPVFIYIMPNGELRGGSWAVLDTLINPDHIEMYACDTSYANILESSGLVAVKYRENDILKTIARIEKSKFDSFTKMGNAKYREQQMIDKKDILSHYLKVAEYFASLHDTPTRMLRKNVIKNLIPWPEAREFFFWRLQRRLHENKIFNDLKHVNKDFLRSDATFSLKTLYVSMTNENENLESIGDKKFVYWLNDLFVNHPDIYSEHVKELKNRNIAEQIKTLLSSNPQFTRHTLEKLLEKY